MTNRFCAAAEFHDRAALHKGVQISVNGHQGQLGKQQLQLLIRAQIIKQTLCAAPELQLHFAEVMVDESGTVTLRGNVASSSAARRAEEIVAAMPEVSAVNNELVVVLQDIPNRLPPFMH